MLEGTKKLFPKDYDKLREVMIQAAEQDKLPIALSLEEDKGFTLKDFRDLFYDFKKDTGLQMTATLYSCDVCDELHTIIEIDMPEVINNGMVQ